MIGDDVCFGVASRTVTVTRMLHVLELGKVLNVAAGKNSLNVDKKNDAAYASLHCRDSWSVIRVSFSNPRGLIRTQSRTRCSAYYFTRLYVLADLHKIKTRAPNPV